jgi:hypothetical protein
MAITGYQGLWTQEAQGTPGYQFLVNKNPIRNRLKRVMNRESMRIVTELFDTLIGAAAGGAALATHKRVAAVSPFLGGGGNRTIETITDINRVSTAADVTMLKEMVFGVKTRPSPYVRDLSGNGGPAY